MELVKEVSWQLEVKIKEGALYDLYNKMFKNLPVQFVAMHTVQTMLFRVYSNNI